MSEVPCVEFVDIPDLVRKVTELTPVKRFWFRGQGCAGRHLSPSLWRRLEASSSGQPPDAKQVLDAEIRLLTRFRQRSLPYWPAGYPQSNWEHLFTMQHYGIPTRLLDWTTSLLMSVFFSLEHDVNRCECGTKACLPTIWLLDPVRLNRTNPRLDGLPVGVLATSDKHAESWEPGVDETLFAPAPVALHGTHNSERIAAQAGAFTVAGKTVKPLEQVITGTETLTKFVATGSRDSIKEQLRLLGVSRSSAYPGLAELAHDITEEELG
ncbi:FRG domain-containing protein [Gordonia sp. NPDC003376]